MEGYPEERPIRDAVVKDFWIDATEHQPVVQVTRRDAAAYAAYAAYAAWAGKALPTETQWEYAAQGRGQGERIERGPRDAEGAPSANFWQGFFPYIDTGEDGHVGRSPVGCCAANGHAVHDLIGNVWEWTQDSWNGAEQYHGTGPALVRPLTGQLGLIKGGSFLRSSDFCVRYRSAARHPQEVDVAASHVGFRTVSR